MIFANDNLPSHPLTICHLTFVPKVMGEVWRRGSSLSTPTVLKMEELFCILPLRYGDTTTPELLEFVISFCTVLDFYKF